MRLTKALLLLVFSAVFPLLAHAQAGKLAGEVVDAAGEPLTGATVLIVGTQQGAAADLEGRYVVLNIPPGTYSVRYSMVGFSTKVVAGLRIQSNLTTEQNVVLQEEVFEGEEVVVTAERPIVDISLTSAMATVSREDIEMLPVQTLSDIVNLQAGVVDGHFRGGRAGEVQYQVDGVSVNNPYDNSSSLQLDRSVLQEVQVISGTFDAEYGQAMSGVVNAVLRSGSPDRYEFSAETYFGDYVSAYGCDGDIVELEPLENLGDCRFPYIDKISPAARQNYQLSLSGPVPLLPHTTFLMSGQRLYDEGYLFGQRIFLPTDSVNFQEGYLTASGDGEIVPLKYSDEWSFLGKLSNRSLGSVSLEYQAIGNIFEKKNSYKHDFRLNPDGTRTQEQFSIVHGLDITHTLSDRTYYTLAFRQNYFDYSDLMYDDVDDPRYFEAGLPESQSSVLLGANLKGVELGRHIQRTNSLVSKGSITSQLTNVHLVKAGYEVMRSDLDFGPPGIIVSVTHGGVQQLQARTDTLTGRVVSFSPLQAAAFVQDRIEWRDLRIRAGVRLEYFDANTTVPSDPANPANAIEGQPESHPQATTVKAALAPRLGVSFPILDRASLFFSFGHFYQMPSLGQMFNNADYEILEDLQFGAEEEKGVLGNPDLKPEFTSQYEFGFKSEINRYVGLDVSMFYKDIRDLLGVEFIQTYAAARYARFTNVDFGQVRGFTISLDQRGPGPISTSLDYTLQLAEGNSSDPRETFNRQSAGEDARPRQIPFNWDQRHTLNGTISWYKPNNFAITSIIRFGSGQPFTPQLASTFGSDLEPNSGRKSSFLLVDLRLEKFFTFGGLQMTAFGRVFNLFDEHFVNGFIFASTGSPFYTTTPSAQRALLIDPSRFHAPRRIEIGVSFRGVIDR